MRIRYIFCAVILTALTFEACNSGSPVTTPPVQSSYVKIITAEQGSTKFEVYSATSSTMVNGYNDIGFKVYTNGTEMTSGYVTFFPKMYHHFNGSPYHSTPCSPKFYYSSDKQMFMGYTTFMMWTDTNADWFGWYNYNGTSSVDSAKFIVNLSDNAQVKTFVDNSTETIIYLTLVAPLNPKQGLNDFQILAHRTYNELTYWEADSLEMYIRTWMPLMGHSSSDNVNPVSLGGGLYKGKVNYNMSGQWYVYDSIKYNGGIITPAPPPKFIFDAP